ncbi:helix-turn-helix domain-containing protein [Pontibaca methylaminivorans]|uniref:helix-turn-helix domain-containing protein n=1 Tax=Pontibaca methylaminivorans TaxID=515897 RepID=UPI002FD90B45
MTEHQEDWFGPETATFGDRLAGAREAAGMTQTDLARRLGVKKTTLVAWEDDLAEPRANRLTMMAGLTNVSVQWLLTGEGVGAEAPEDSVPVPHDLSEALHELREIRASLRSNAERAAQLEKALRRVLLGQAAG